MTIDPANVVAGRAPRLLGLENESQSVSMTSPPVNVLFPPSTVWLPVTVRAPTPDPLFVMSPLMTAAVLVERNVTDPLPTDGPMATPRRALRVEAMAKVVPASRTRYPGVATAG